MKKISSIVAFAAALSACTTAPPGSILRQSATAGAGELEVYSTIDGLLQRQAQDMARRMGWVDGDTQTFRDYDVVT